MSARLQYRFHDTVCVLHDIVVPESDHAEAMSTEPFVAYGVIASRFVMLSAVDFDDYPHFQAHEIDNVASNGKLAPEAQTVELAQP